MIKASWGGGVKNSTRANGTSEISAFVLGMCRLKFISFFKILIQILYCFPGVAP